MVPETLAQSDLCYKRWNIRQLSPSPLRWPDVFRLFRRTLRQKGQRENHSIHNGSFWKKNLKTFLKKTCKKRVFFKKKNGSRFWHRFGSRNGGTTKCNPTVCFISLPPISGNQKRTRFLEPTFFFGEPFFRFRSFWNDLLAASRTTWNNWQVRQVGGDGKSRHAGVSYAS